MRDNEFKVDWLGNTDHERHTLALSSTSFLNGFPSEVFHPTELPYLYPLQLSDYECAVSFSSYSWLFIDILYTYITKKTEGKEVQKVWSDNV